MVSSPRRSGLRLVFKLRYYLVTGVYVLLLYLAYISVSKWFGTKTRQQWMIEYLSELPPGEKLDILDSLSHGHSFYFSRWGGALRLEAIGSNDPPEAMVDTMAPGMALTEEGILWEGYAGWNWHFFAGSGKPIRPAIPGGFFPSQRNIPACTDPHAVLLEKRGGAEGLLLYNHDQVQRIDLSAIPEGATVSVMGNKAGVWYMYILLADNFICFRILEDGSLRQEYHTHTSSVIEDWSTGRKYSPRFRSDDARLLLCDDIFLIIDIPAIPAEDTVVFRPRLADTLYNEELELSYINESRLAHTPFHMVFQLPTDLRGPEKLRGFAYSNDHRMRMEVYKNHLVQYRWLINDSIRVDYMVDNHGKLVSHSILFPGKASGGVWLDQITIFPGIRGGAVLVSESNKDSIRFKCWSFSRKKETVTTWAAPDSILLPEGTEVLALNGEVGAVALFPPGWLGADQQPWYFSREAESLRPLIREKELQLLRKFTRVEYRAGNGQVYFRCCYGNYYMALLQADPSTGELSFIPPYRDINPSHLPFSHTRLQVDPFISSLLFVMAALVYFALLMLVNYLLRDSQQTKAPDHISIWPDLPGALREKYHLLHDNSQALRVRSDIMLLMGVLIGIFGLAFFWAVSSGASAAAAGDVDWIVRIRPLALLVFIETIAFFFLRQYRIIYNEYKRFAGLKIRLMNFITTLEMYMKPTNTFPEGEQLKNLLNILQNEPLNLTSKTDEPLDTNMLLDLLKQAMNK